MKGKLQDVKVAMLLCDGFEESEMTKPRAALLDLGATVDLISPNPTKVRAFQHHKWSKQYKVDVKLKDAKPTQYDALILPGGVINPDSLRTYDSAVKFAKYFLKNKKPLAAICHGPITLIETGLLKKRKMTSYPSIKTDLKNAGAKWHDKKVIVDDNLITSRKPSDIPAFNEALIKMIIKKKVKKK